MTRFCKIVIVFAILYPNAGLKAQTTLPSTSSQPTRAGEKSAGTPEIAKIEKPETPGALVTLGSEEIGKMKGLKLEARQVQVRSGISARGLVVQVSTSGSDFERIAIDEDEIPGLLKAIDAILSIKQNPTEFSSFEVSYATRRGLRIAAFDSDDSWNSVNGVAWEISITGPAQARRICSPGDISTFRELVEKGAAKLNSTRVKK